MQLDGNIDVQSAFMQVQYSMEDGSEGLRFFAQGVCKADQGHVYLWYGDAVRAN